MDSRGMTWDLMAWGFTKTGDHARRAALGDEDCHTPLPGTLRGDRPRGAVMIYNTPQRSGWLTGWHQDLLGEGSDLVPAATGAVLPDRERLRGSHPAPGQSLLHLQRSTLQPGRLP